MSSSSPEMAHAFVLPVPISVSATFGDFLASEAQLPMAPHTWNSWGGQGAVVSVCMQGKGAVVSVCMQGGGAW